jgi:tRNA A-37 threonylcarbamoyl transferase component Bud32
MKLGQLIHDRYKIGPALQTQGPIRLYRVNDTQTNRDCLLKIFADPDSPTAQRRCDREASILRQLDHPQIPSYIDQFTLDNHPALIQSWIPGDTYRQSLDRKPFNDSHIRTFLSDILPVLTYLHNHSPSIVHGHLSPSHLLFSTDSSKPVLFNFSHASQNNGNPGDDLYRLAFTCLLLLTPPEQLGHEGLEALFDGRTRSWQIPRNISADLTQILVTMLHPDPQKRYPSAAAVQSALQNFPVATPNATVPIPHPGIPKSQMATLPVGRPSLDAEDVHGGQPNEMWPPLLALFIPIAPFLSKLLYRAGIPLIGGIVLFGFGHKVLSIVQESWRPIPSEITVIPSPLATSTPVAVTDSTDCRDIVLAKGETAGITNWDAVDQKFLTQYPDVVKIDPFNPAHKPYIQSWCDLAEDQIKQAAR